MTTIDRPLKLGEILAEAVRIYSGRGFAYLGIGLFEGMAFIAASIAPSGVGLAIVSAAFAAAYAATARLVAGDPFGEAWGRVARTAAVLAVLAFVVAVPFTLATTQLLLLIVSVGWLGLTGFAIPAAMLDADPASRVVDRIGYALRRSLTLARAEYLHAVGVSAALVIIYLLVGIVLATAIVSFAENGRVAALALVQIALAPFFFIGLTVLYFDQCARALSSAGQPGGRR